MLLTRRERLRSYGERTALLVGPSLVLALVALAIGSWVDAVLVVAIAGMAALALGSAVRTRLPPWSWGSCSWAGSCCSYLAIAWLGSHPIQRGD